MEERSEKRALNSEESNKTMWKGEDKWQKRIKNDRWRGRQEKNPRLFPRARKIKACDQKTEKWMILNEE